MYGPYPTSSVGLAGDGNVDGIFDVVKSIGKGIVRAAGGGAKSIAKAAGGAAKAGASVVKTVVHTASTAVNAAGDLVDDIPVVGDVVQFASTAVTAPIHLASAIASGARIDRALEGELKRQLKNVKDIAPYVQTVLTMVPGIGTGVAAAAAAGIALAEGKSIDEITKAAIRGGLPGGPAAAAAYDTMLKVASGANVVKSTLESARNALPANLRSAADIAVAVATGEKIQNALAAGLANMAGAQAQQMLTSGAKAIAATPALQNVLKTVKSAAEQDGVKMAAGLLGSKGINEKALRAVRDKLAPAQRAGFDAVLKSQAHKTAWLGNVVHAPPRMTAFVPPKKAPPRLTSAVPRTAPPRLTASPTISTGIKPADQRRTIATHANKAIQEATGPATGTILPEGATPSAVVAPSGGGVPYGAYPQAGVGVGAFLSSDKWRWFAVYNGNRPISNRGPVKMSDYAARQEEAAFLESTQGRGYFGDVYRWDWDADARTWRQASRSGVGLAGCGGPPCRSFGPPIADMPHGMHQAGLSAVNSNRGQPRMVTSPDGTDYRFALEGGRLVARACLR